MIRKKIFKKHREQNVSLQPSYTKGNYCASFRLGDKSLFHNFTIRITPNSSVLSW